MAHKNETDGFIKCIFYKTYINLLSAIDNNITWSANIMLCIKMNLEQQNYAIIILIELYFKQERSKSECTVVVRQTKF